LLRDRLIALGVTPAFLPAGGIERFAAACAALGLLVCNDSGVMHIAAALGIPTLSFHALGRPAEWGPVGPSSIALYSKAALEKIPVAHALQSAQAILEFRKAAAPKP
jgi:ADP-heptose:LPS heptosyltransferase